MDFSDTTVVIPAKDERAVFDVADDVLRSLGGCRVLVIYNGYGGKPLRFGSKRVSAVSVPSGKGRAIITMQKRRLVKTPIMCFIDGDATYEPKNLRRMVEMVRDGYDMVLGDRMSRIKLDAMPKSIQTGNRIITWFANLLYGLNLSDSQTGLRAMKTSAFQELELVEQQFGIETEMNIKMKRGGLRIGEVRADYYPRVGETKQMKMIGGVKHILIELRFLFYGPKGGAVR